jgi:hypothetical protein
MIYPFVALALELEARRRGDPPRTPAVLAGERVQLLEAIGELARDLDEALGRHTPLPSSAHVLRSQLEEVLDELHDLEPNA